ncbi:hypothetical protein FI667_g13134, partial [Globisporangium splendens]
MAMPRRHMLLLFACALCDRDGVMGLSDSGSSTDASTWHMLPVRSFQARVETDAPLWDATHEVFVSGHDPNNSQLTFEERYRNTLDSVTTSSIEGALMYLQRDCIDVGANPIAAGCKRRNDVKVITFMEITIAQPFEALSYYQADRYIYPEFCPFVAMCNGQCVEIENDDNDGEDEDDDIVANPPKCQLYNGLDTSMSSWEIGPCVGAHAYPTDIVAPYPNTVWFSYPNSCVMNTWKEGKSDECREKYKGGLCPFGVEPDGVKCSFAYKIIGYLSIDELVGIVKADWSSSSGSSGSAVSTVSTPSSSADGQNDDEETRRKLVATATEYYDDYKDFCEAKQIELHAFDTDDTLGLKNVTAISFWKNPSDTDANVARTNAMIAMYNDFVANEQTNVGSRMQSLPTNLTALTNANPPCYQNAKLCYDSKFGAVVQLPDHEGGADCEHVELIIFIVIGEHEVSGKRRGINVNEVTTE